MFSDEFETLLTTTYGCYVIKPSAINWNTDSDFLPYTNMLTILVENRDDISNCVRKRAEGVGNTSFYFRNVQGTQYFKTVLNNATTGGGNMGNIKQYFDEHPDQRMLFKYGVIYGASLAAAFLGYKLSQGAFTGELLMLIPVVIAYLNEKVKPLDPSKPWPIVGSGKGSV
jgi:hypothetical protein